MAVIPNRLYEYPQGARGGLVQKGYMEEKILGTIDL
jgi:hypothetical protein